MTADVAVAATAAQIPLSLDGIDTTPLASGHFGVITTGALTGKLYRLDAASTAAPDGVTVIAPLTGPGRWLEWAGPGGGGGFFVVNGIATGTTQLQNVPTSNMATGTTAYVQSVEDAFVFDAAGGLTADGITVVDGLDGGQWVRRENVGSEVWRTQDEWHINATTGNDENAGDAANPLATWAELRRRLGVNPVIRQDTEVSIESDLAEVLSFNGMCRLSGGVLFAVRGGVKAVLQSGTLSLVTPQDRASQQPLHLEDAGLDAFVDERIRFTDGAAAGATCWGFRSPGADQLECTQSVTFDTSAAPLPSVPTQVTPSGGDGYVVEQLFEVAAIQLAFDQADVVSSAVAEDLHATDATLALQFYALTGNALARCKAAAGGVSAPSGKNSNVVSCFINSSQHQGFESVAASLLKSPASTVFVFDTTLNLSSDTIVANGALRLIAATLRITDFAAFFDSNASGIILDPNSKCLIRSAGSPLAWGNGNSSFGFEIRAGAVATYKAGNKPTLTGDLADTNIGGANLAYAAIPTFDTSTASGLVEDV